MKFKDCLYIKNSCMFDSRKYESEKYMKVLKNAGAKKVWTEHAYNWSNQPKVVVFAGLTKEAATISLENAFDYFRRQGVIICKLWED